MVESVLNVAASHQQLWSDLFWGSFSNLWLINLLIHRCLVWMMQFDFWYHFKSSSWLSIYSCSQSCSASLPATLWTDENKVSWKHVSWSLGAQRKFNETHLSGFDSIMLSSQTSLKINTVSSSNIIFQLVIVIENKDLFFSMTSFGVQFFSCSSLCVRLKRGNWSSGNCKVTWSRPSIKMLQPRYL